MENINYILFRKEKLFNKIILILFILTLFSDFFIKINSYNDFLPNFRYSGIAKLLFEAFLIFIVLLKDVQKKLLMLEKKFLKLKKV